MTKSLLTSLAVLAALGAAPAWAQDATLDELQKELRTLRSEVMALRLALSQMAELDRQRANIVSRALDTVVAPAPTAGAPRSAPGLGDRGAKPAAVAVAPPPVPAAPAPASEKAPALTAAVAAPSVSAASRDGMITGRVEVPAGEPVAYVYVENVRAPAAKAQTVTMEQLRKQFAPRWAVIQRGTTIEFPNLDNVYHNVFSRSTGNSFDLGLYSGADGAKSHTFVTAGAVDIYCNIHPQMSARVLVVPNGHFAKVKPDGTFSIPNVPAGKRKVVAWAPGADLASGWVDLDDGGAELSLKLESRKEGHLNKMGRPYGSYE